ncbi:hypothetical protein QUG92_08660 [Curtobacterium sp. RHCKG23]|uniref:DUF4190 domain-containing protein n=1 Tax=Curtobacterium citri TaxID=3055139 RepID=A0ABT7T6G9_9MICO|nr:hypothetical protein [Curtobacterium citri]MDM7885176.1 hypothetical protein [Curtobacterium citri]
MLLGLGSLVMALVEPQQGSVQSGFVASTIGVTAVVIGRRLMADRSRFGNVARAFGRGAVMLGSVGTALMAYAVLAFGLSTVGVEWPALSLPAAQERQMPVDGLPAAAATPESAATQRAAGNQAPEEMAPEAAPSLESETTDQKPVPIPAETVVPQAPTVPEPTTFDAERSAVAMGAGTLAFALEQRFGVGTYPTDLTTMGAPARIALLDGTGLAPVPTDARVLYSVAPDRTAWTVTIIGARFGATATYSSAIGTVQAG